MKLASGTKNVIRSVNDSRGAERRVWSKRTTALCRLGKLVGLVEVPLVVRIIHSIMEPAAAQRVPGINTKRPAIGRAISQDLRLAALIAYHGPAGWSGTIAKGHALIWMGENPAHDAAL